MELDKLATSPDDIIREARERFRLASDAESRNRTDAITALQFINGDQWPVDVRRDRETDARPCLTINITEAVTRRIKNACRENRPRIKIDPVGDGGDIETAKVLNGLTRHIEAISGAEYAYDCAQGLAIDAGWGWMSVVNDFVDDKAFDQELLIQAHPNPFKIYPDPSSTAPDGSDLTWLIESEFISRIDYKAKYDYLDPGGWQLIGQGDDLADWNTKEQIRVAKYWRVEHKDDELWKLADGRDVFRSSLGNGALDKVGMVTRKRRVVRKQVKAYLMSAFRVLKEWDWPERFIPYVPVYGREMNINGKVIRRGMVKDLMDPGRMYNYSETSKTEVYALQPKAPWLMPAGSMEGHESAWRDANRKPIVALEYKQMYSADGVTPLPGPQRQPPPPLGAGFQEWSQTTQSNFMAVAGMPHEPNQDAKGEVVSGVAIRRRQGLSDISHFDFYDNFCRSLRQLGRILVDLFPHFYSTERMLRIIREDGTSELVRVNQKAQGPDGVSKVKYDLSVGRYDVIVDTGPAYQTKREQSAEALLELLSTPLGQLVATSAGDKVIRAMDFPDADLIADRLAAQIPAAQAEKQLQNMSQDQLKSLVAGLQAQLANANKQLMAAHLEIQAKHGLEQIRQQGEDRRHQLTEETKRADALTKAHTSLTDTHVKAQAGIVEAEIGATAQILGKHVDNVHEKELAEKQLASAEKLAKEKPSKTE